MGLRESKKVATRLAISDVATKLFLERGFDAVSVADVAAAANVSKMTVFNYFARKEDLLFDRDDEARAFVREAIFERRTKGESLVECLLALGRRLAAEQHPFAKWTPSTEKFFDLVQASPSLVSRTRELREEAEAHLAAILAEAAGAPKDDAVAMILSVGMIAAWRRAYGAAAHARRAGKRSPEHVFVRELDAALDPLRRAARGTPYGRGR